MTNLTCPKCAGAMRTYERNGIAIDQCAECRGIFLDRGELEHLLDAEAAYTAATTQPASPVSAPGPAGDQGWPTRGYGGKSGGQHGSDGGGHHGKRKKGFLGELFD